MNNHRGHHNFWVVWMGFVFAYLLAIFPLSGSLLWMRPEFVALLVIYWTLELPHDFGVLSAWLIGLGQDVVENAVLGQHALALSIIAYVCLMSYQRLRNYAILYQTVWVFLLVGVHQLFCNWVEGLGGRSADVWQFLVPAFASALIWPLVKFIMSVLRIHYRVV